MKRMENRLAERGGFELPEPVKAHSLSRRAQSTTLPPLRCQAVPSVREPVGKAPHLKGPVRPSPHPECPTASPLEREATAYPTDLDRAFLV